MSDNSKKKILIVHNYYQVPGGEDTVVANEKKMLEDHGHEVVLYSRNNSELRQFSLKKLALPFTAIFNPRTYIDVRKLIKKKKIEIVHVHNTLSLISPSVYYAALSLNVPVVQTMHNFRLLCPGASFYRDGHICEDCVEQGLNCSLKHRCYRKSWIQTLICVINLKIHRMTGVYGKLNYVCLSEFNKEKLLKLKQIRETRVYVKPNFTFQAESEKVKREFYLYIGRIEEIKGVPLLIEAFSRMPDRRLILAGAGSELQHYREMISDKGSKNIELVGFVEKKKLADLLKYTRALIVASQWYETFGMVVIEAFASRTPVIVGDIGNIGGLVDEGMNGLKFQYDSVDALVHAVNHFEQLDIVALEENAKQKYIDFYSENKNYENMMVIYQSASAEGKNIL